MRQHRVAVVQAGTSLFDTPRTLDRMAAHCEAAKSEGVELAVFPEAYVGGYPKGLDFGARIGTRTSAGREDYLRYWRSAIRCCAMRWSNTKHSPRHRLCASGMSSRYFRMPPLRW